MRAADSALYTHIASGLDEYEKLNGSLRGASGIERRNAFIQQVIASVRRRTYMSRLQDRQLSNSRTDPHSQLFDPLKAAIVSVRTGDMEEACWLAFLSVHFGRHRINGWRYCAAVYARDDELGRWTWQSVVHDVPGFASWVTGNAERIRKAGGGFGNHRKYESLSATAETISSYLSWVGTDQSQMQRLRNLIGPANGDPHVAFDLLYRSMNDIARFGRTARFDYLTLVARLGLVPIISGRAYLEASTGPLSGARLLFDDPTTMARGLDEGLIEIDRFLNVGFDVLEDALCNWQKSPSKFIAFRG